MIGVKKALGRKKDKKEKEVFLSKKRMIKFRKAKLYDYEDYITITIKDFIFMIIELLSCYKKIILRGLKAVGQLYLLN